MNFGIFGTRELSVILRCQYYDGVRKERFDFTCIRNKSFFKIYLFIINYTETVDSIVGTL